jgi:predicted DNA-binding transcriptional regulator YafY
MPSSHRFAWIDAQIRAGRYPNARTIAERFEISQRQAARDIEYLRYSMGAPLEYSPSRNGYFYTDDTFALPAVMLTDSEQSTLTYLADRYAGLEGEAAARVAALLKRLGGRAVADGSPEVPLADLEASELRVLDALRSAMRDRTKVIVRYRDAEGVVLTRTLSPHTITTRFGALSCHAWTDELGERRFYTLSRVEAVEPTDERYEIPGYFEKDHGWGDERLPLPPRPFRCVLRLTDERDAEHIEGAISLRDGTWLVEFSDSPTVLSILLACRHPFEVVSPAWLRSKLRERVSRVLEGLT